MLYKVLITDLRPIVPDEEQALVRNLLWQHVRKFKPDLEDVTIQIGGNIQEARWECKIVSTEPFTSSSDKQRWTIEFSEVLRDPDNLQLYLEYAGSKDQLGMLTDVLTASFPFTYQVEIIEE